MEPGWYSRHKLADPKLDPRLQTHHSEDCMGPWLRKDLTKVACLWVVSEDVVGSLSKCGKFTKIAPDVVKDMVAYNPRTHGDVCFLSTMGGQVICVLVHNPGMLLTHKVLVRYFCFFMGAPKAFIGSQKRHFANQGSNNCFWGCYFVVKYVSGVAKKLFRGVVFTNLFNGGGNDTPYQ